MKEYYRILAIDYGKKRIGLAITDLMRIVISTLNHLENKGMEESLEFILKLSNENEIKKIILGCPIENKQNSVIVLEIIEFYEKLKSKLNCDIEIVDESFSSQKAVIRMIETGKKKKYRSEKGNLDSFSAAIILEEYLQNAN